VVDSIKCLQTYGSYTMGQGFGTPYNLFLCFGCSPFYGKRRPPLQSGSRLLCVSDLLLLGRATIEEARTLLYWMQNEIGFKKLGVCGLSMGNPLSSVSVVFSLQ
jgi:hypothetical protein